MKTTVLLSVILAVASGAEWTSLHTKWEQQAIDPLRNNSFFVLPLAISDAEEEGWVLIKGLNSLNLTTYCYPNDGQLCMLYGSYGRVVGLQIGILAVDVDPAGNMYPTSKIDILTNKTLFGEKYVTATVYLQDPANLKAGKCGQSNRILGTSGIWIEKRCGSYTAIPINVKDFDQAWTKESCIPAMGTHYYYGMNETLSCEEFRPFFLMTQDEEVTGFGMQTFGKCTKKEREWCDRITWRATKPTIPNAPECLVDWIKEHGIISRHFFLTSEPWNIKCQ